MADDEWLRFQAELAAVEQTVEPQAAAVGPAAALGPPAAPPPTRPPPAAVAHAAPVVSKPPAPAAAAPQGPQFSAPPAVALPPPSTQPQGGAMGGSGFQHQQQQGMFGQAGMMQQGMGGMGMGMGGMGMGMGGMGMGMGMAGMGMGMGMGGMGMGMGMGGMGMGGMGMQQQQAAGGPSTGAAAGASGAGAAGAAKPGGSKPQQPGGKKKVLLREAGGQKWVDPSLNEWPENDFRIFVGDLGNEVTDDLLARSFSKYSSFAKAKIVRDPRTKKSKGYGFVSFMDGNDFAKALREMNGKYIGNRPCKLSKSNWDERTVRKVTLKEPKAKKQKR